MADYTTLPDFDAHEHVEFVEDAASGLKAIIAIHSTHLGPAAGGTRFWRYANADDAMRDALRLSRGMSYKNAMAGLPMGGGKAVILAGADGRKTPEMLAAFGRAVERLEGRYVTAEDVGMSEADMVAIGHETRHVCGLPVGEGEAGGDPGPFTALGVFSGIKAAVGFRLGRSDLDGIHVAIQGVGSVGGGVARQLAKAGARIALADIDAARAARVSGEVGARVVSPDEIMNVPCDVFSPNALGAILDDDSIARLDCAIVAGGANNQLARSGHGEQLARRGILYAPDYVINSGGIINVSLEYLCRMKGEPCTADQVRERISCIPERLEEIWSRSADTGLAPDQVADRMAQELIGRGPAAG